MAEHRKLLLRDRPKADESLLGFIVRLTELNDYDTPTWIVQEAKLGDIWYQCPFVKKNIDIEPLAKLSGRSVAELKHLLYLPADGSSKFLTPRVILSQTVPTYVIRIQNPKICPACIGEFGYCRKVWDLAPLTCCPIHRCLLLAECPKCKRRIRWSRNSISRCSQPCGYNWANAPLQIVDDIGLALSRQIHLLCGLATGKAPPQEFIADTPLAKLELEYLISSVAFIASQLGRFIDTKWKFFVSIRENERIHQLLTKALLVFTNWPENFFSFLDWRRLQTGKELSSGFQNEFNEYRNALYQQLSSRHFDFLRDAFEEYLVAHWDGGHASQLRRLRNTPVQLRRYVSQREAKDLLSTTWQAISKYVAAGRLSAIEKGRGRGRVRLIEASSVLRLVEELNNGLCMAQVREKLALHDMRVKELIKGGILNPLSGPAIGAGDWRFKAQEVNALIAKIEDTLPNKAFTPKRDRINLWQTLRKLGRVGLRLDALISTVINQEILLCAKTGPGISGLLFSHKSVDEYVSRNAKFLDDYLSLEDVRKTLNVSDTAIRHLVNIGLVRAEKKEGVQRLGLLIAKSDFNHFTSNYVFAGKIARALGTNAGFLTRLLGSLGVRPITGPRIGGGMVNLFRKTDVECLDLSDIIAAARVRIAITRKEVFLVNATTAAKRLNISEHEIERLVDGGMLKPYKRGSYKNRADGPYFTEDVIGQYKERRTAYDELVSTQTAIKILGVAKNTFYRRYIHPTRLVAVMGDSTRTHYFRRTDVEAIAEIDKSLIGSPEAAKILGVSKYYVHDLTVAGMLKPVRGPRVDDSGINLYQRADVEKLREERDAFKAARVKHGKTMRFGCIRARRRPVLDSIGLYIDMLIKKWSTLFPEQQISGAQIYRQLVKEGYKTGICSVYLYLRTTRCLPAAG